MSLLITIAAFLVAIGILVTIHELGHYFAARWCDVKILRFSVGFGKPLWLRRQGPDQTEWVIAAIPLGGYVKMADERDETVDMKDRLRAYNNKSVSQRSFIVLAGPAANFLLAGFFYWVLLFSGTPGLKPVLAEPRPGTLAAEAGFKAMEKITSIDGKVIDTWGEARMALLEHASAKAQVDVGLDDGQRKFTRQLDLSSITKDDLDKDFLGKVGIALLSTKGPFAIGEVVPDGAAAAAGLARNDLVVSVEGKEVDGYPPFVELIRASAGKELRIEIIRANSHMLALVTPREESVGGKLVGRIGVAPVNLGITVRANPVAAFYQATVKVWDMSMFSLKMMWRMLTGHVSWKNLSGPVTIADYAGQTAQMGWIPYVNFLALISISLGVLNLLPIPVLDGGQLMYHIAEFFKGSPVSERVMAIGQQAGLAVLLGLTAFAFYNDIHRLLSG